MRRVLVPVLLTVGLCSAADAAAPTTAPAPAAPPAYTPVRWNEDYLYLRNPDRRTDFFDSIKYIALNEEGDWYISLGGQARYRYEWFNNATFSAGPQDDDGFHLLRVLTHADAHLGPNLRAFVQVVTAQADGRDGGERPFIDENDFDFHQAFIDVNLPIDDDMKLLLRGGRQNLLYGAQRLISPLDWTNTRRTFDGGKASFQSPKNNTLDFFYVHPVVIDEGPLDSYNNNVAFTGFYDTLMLPDVIRNAGTRVEAYALYLDNEAANFAGSGIGGENRYTIGGRFYTNPKPWDFDVEAAYQFGDFGGGDVSAWMLATEVGYTVTGCPTTPRAYIGVDIASGDDDPADGDLETFNQLFPLGHAYFGYIDVIGRQNIIDLHPGLELTLLGEKRYVKKLSLRGDYHLFWRQSEDDAVYNAAGGVLRADLGSDAEYVGSEIDLLLNWQIDRHWTAYLGYSHFFAGDFISDTGASNDIDFVYAAVQLTF